MGRERREACKQNNKGMTLVEVLVAMVVLSLVSLVFYRSLSQTLYYNRLAKEKQYALTVAQSMMEGMKAYGMDDLDAQFAGSPSDFKLYPPAADSGKGGSCASGGYTINEITVGGFHFNVEISVKKAEKPGLVTASKLAFGSETNRYNDAFYIQGEDGTREQDVVYKGLVQAIESFPDIHESETNNLTWENARDKVKWSYVDLVIEDRALKVEIGENTVTVKNEYRYKYTITDYPYRRSSDPEGTTSGVYSLVGGGTISDSDTGKECYNNTNTVDSGAQLENVYLYYLPSYNSTQGGYISCIGDTIQITNNSGREINVFAVKQRNLDMSPAELAICESSYNVHIGQYGGDSINLYHNLKEKLEGDGDSNYSIATPAALTDKHALWEEDTVDRILLYEVTVSVKDISTNEVVYELSGTVNEK